MEKFLKKINNWQDYLLAISSLIYFLYFTVASFLKYDHYYSGRFDLGNMAQTTWNTIHGNIFQLTNPNSTENISRLAFHADFILILLSPFYALWQNPKMLLLIQSFILSLGGVFVYLLAKKILKNKTVALAIAICFFLNPAVNYANLFDFHPVALATTFLIAAFYFLYEKRYAWMVVFLVLAALTKEQVWFILFLVGVYLAIFRGEKKLGAVISVVSIAIFYFLFWWAIPKSLGNQHFALSYYSEFGDNPSEIIKNIFLSPKKSLELILLPDRIGYLRQLFIPLGYLSIFAPFFLVFAGPDLAIGLLSSNPTLHQIYYQYSSTITPFVFISLIFGIKYLRKWLPEISLVPISLFILLMTLISAHSYGPLPFAKKPTIAMFTNPLSNRKVVDEYLAAIPKEDKVSATNNLASHLSNRRDIYVIPMGIDKADRVMFLMDRSSNPKEEEALAQMKSDPRFFMVFSDKSFFVFKRLKN